MENLKFDLPKFYPAQVEPFDAIEYLPVFEDEDGSVSVCEEGQHSYWAVYIHMVGGGIDCIADVATKEQAMELTCTLEKLFVNYKPTE